MYLESIDKTIVYEGAIEEKNLEGVDLSLLSDCDLRRLYMEVVGYAENLVEFEMESRI